MINWNNWQGRYANLPLSFRVCILLRDFRSDLQNPRAQNHPQAWGNDGAVAIAEILQFATNNMEQFNYIGLARSIHILAGVARIANGLDWVPDDAVAQFENAWIVAATNQLGNFNPQELANSIGALANLNHHNEQFENAWIVAATNQLGNFNPQNLANSIWALANLNHPNEQFENAWIVDATNQLGNFNPQELANSIRALANLNHHNEQFENAWIVAATNQLGNFNPQNLANTIWALAHLNVDNMGFNGNMLQQLRTINYFNNYQGAMDSIWQIENARHEWHNYQNLCIQNNVPQDGNCFYSAVANRLNLANQHVARVLIHEEIVGMIGNPNNEHNEIATALYAHNNAQDILQNGVWDDNVELQIIALNQAGAGNNIGVIDLLNGLNINPGFNNNDLHYNGCHYF